MNNYKELAKAKFYQSTDMNFDLGFDDFIADCYVRLKPCSYGGIIEKKIRKDVNLISVAPSENRGDVIFGGDRAEIKVSYLGKNRSYRLTHLRGWQDFKYYIICFVDCENDFEYELYLLDKTVMNNFKLVAMNGTHESNSENGNIEMCLTVKKGGDKHNIFKDNNLLSGTKIGDLINFVSEMECSYIM